MTREEQKEHNAALNNPYVGQSEPAGGCTNEFAENPRWDSSIGCWRATVDGRPIIVVPNGNVIWL